jgi:hypothetical protein
MARRPLAGRDKKIIQGHRRDAFFARMRRKGGTPRAANQAPEMAAAVAGEELDDATPVDETASGAATAAEGEAEAEAAEPASAEGG